MNLELVDKAFAAMIVEEGVESRLQLRLNYVNQLRKRVRDGGSISLAKKLDLLRRYGWKPLNYEYTHGDVVDAVKFTINTSEQARKFGPEYVVQKWKARKGR